MRPQQAAGGGPEETLLSMDIARKETLLSMELSPNETQLSMDLAPNETVLSMIYLRTRHCYQ